MGNFFVAGAAAMTSNDDTWTTPRDFYNRLNDEFGFTLDAAALASSALCDEWYGPDHYDPSKRDAFAREWSKDSSGAIWLNPPYGRTIKQWVAKANQEAKNGATVVCLVPSRTDTSWWHDYCIMHEVRFVRGRLKFGGGGTAPFASAVIVMKGQHE